MNYGLFLAFNDKPVCKKCVIARYTSKDIDGDSILMCQALLPVAKKCPGDGCRADCPLERMEE